MPSTPTTKDAPTQKDTTDEGPFLVLVDTTYDDHYFAGPFSSREDATTFEAELRGTSIGPFETRTVIQSAPDDLIDAFPSPPEINPQS